MSEKPEEIEFDMRVTLRTWANVAGSAVVVALAAFVLTAAVRGGWGFGAWVFGR